MGMIYCPNGGGSQVASTPCQILNDNANAVHLPQLDAPQIYKS